MERGHRSVRRLRQGDRQLGAVPRDGRPGDRHENVEPSPSRLLSIDAARDGDRKRPGELDRAAGDLLVEGVALGGRFAADQQKPVAFFRLGGDAPSPGFSTRVVISTGSPPGSDDRRLVACFGALLDDRLGAFGLSRPLRPGAPSPAHSRNE